MKIKIETPRSRSVTGILIQKLATLNQIKTAEIKIVVIATFLVALEILRFFSQFFKALPMTGWR